MSIQGNIDFWCDMWHVLSLLCVSPCHRPQLLFFADFLWDKENTYVHRHWDSPNLHAVVLTKTHWLCYTRLAFMTFVWEAVPYRGWTQPMRPNDLHGTSFKGLRWLPPPSWEINAQWNKPLAVLASSFMRHVTQVSWLFIEKHWGAITAVNSIKT